MPIRRSNAAKPARTSPSPSLKRPRAANPTQRAYRPGQPTASDRAQAHRMRMYACGEAYLLGSRCPWGNARRVSGLWLLRRSRIAEAGSEAEAVVPGVRARMDSGAPSSAQARHPAA